MPGHRFDTFGVAPQTKGGRFHALLADKAFDSNWIIADMNEQRALICISQHPRRAVRLQIDTDLYKNRHLIDNFFCNIKKLKTISLRTGKTGASFKAMIYAVAALINSR
jgi:transposase